MISFAKIRKKNEKSILFPNFVNLRHLRIDSMEIKNIEIFLTEYETIEELSADDRKLIREAINATQNSYAPYSHFQVGAAALLQNGKIIIGTNQENAAYPSGLCAERTTVFYANSRYPDQAITTLAIAASNEKGLTPMPISPCGACRQVLIESEERYQHPIRLILYGTKKIYSIENSRTLLPLAFIDKSME